MNDNLIIFPCTTNYLPEARVLLRSLLKHMPAVPVHIMSKDGEADSLKEFANVGLVVNEPKCDSEFRQIRTSRFRHAAEQVQYRVVCLLDADMLCARDFTQIFRMADTGTILACSNNTVFRYIKKDFEAMQIAVPDDIDVIHTSFSSVPLFINPTLNQEFLRAVWTNPTGNDLDVPNLLAQSMGIMDRFYLLTSYTWTNIHHSMVKPETYLKADRGFYYSHQGEPVYMFHGHWLDQNYIDQLIEPMEKNYGYHRPYIYGAQNAINIIKGAYEQYKDRA